MLDRGLSLKYEKYMAIASAAILTAKNVEVPLINDKENILVKKLYKKLCKYLTRTCLRT